MFKHSLLLIYRGFVRSKTTFFINLVGLSTGLACALAVYLWVNDELSFDKYHQNEGRLFRVMENQRTPEGVNTRDGNTPLLAEALQAEMPEIEYAAVATPPNFFPKFTLVGKGKSIRAVGKYAAKGFFRIFTYPLIQGNPDQALVDKNAIVLSAEFATTLFGTPANAIGKSLEWQLADLKQTCVVSGVFDRIPPNSSEQFDFVLSFDAFKDIMKMGRRVDWADANGPFSTFVVLQEGANSEQFNNKIAGLLKRKSAKNANRTLFIEPYSASYLHGEHKNGVSVGGRIEYVKLFSAVATLILVIASINYMNLATAKASRRLKEIGVRKTLGASRATLVVHFLTESVLTAFLALLIAVVLVQIALPQFNEITGKHLTLAPKLSVMAAFLAIALLTGLLAGSYPAFYLSGFKPAAVFRGTLMNSVADLWTRKGLVVFQFTLSVLFIVCVLVIHRQIAFVQAKSLGYDKSNVIYFETGGKSAQQPGAFLAELKRLPGVVNASGMWGFFVEMGPHGPGPEVEWEGRKVATNNLGVNYDLLETLGIQIKEGRSFSRKFRSDSLKIIVNEALVARLGLQHPVGTALGTAQIVGVAKDFHYASLHEKVEPFIFRLEPQAAGTVLVKLAAGQEKETINRLRRFYQQFNAGMPLDYQFLDAAYQAQYASERRVALLSRYFAGLAIVISSLGLLGLTTFTAEKRRKEIGVRKVLGASQVSIVYLLSIDLAKLVIVAIALALPLSYLVVRQWLNSFEYRIPLEIWYFLGAGFLALLVAWITVGTQAVRAARANPVLCLRDE
ncbi:ABC transporter permease [Hymenobacter jejuensis]|uniref:FtsX-like permease family protein n=1 Tax=Hymenobacter jejuensis TaxID=2502781 RepID=A0A5B7ZVA8_9BACT|nr:FtsX-like permease family protein [Hymenobacter jejuensis]QDA58729.1 FtsX-like permease family protein [Hymenobacter jejuensis]